MSVQALASSEFFMNFSISNYSELRSELNDFIKSSSVSSCQALHILGITFGTGYSTGNGYSGYTKSLWFKWTTKSFVKALSISGS